MIIRRVQETDLPQLLEMLPFLNPDDLKARNLADSQDEIVYLVAQEDQKIVGNIILNFRGKNSEPDYPDISAAFVRTEYRGRGIGTTLINRCEELSQNKGFKKIGLAVNPNLNSRAKKLYEKLGYCQTPTPSYLDGIYNGTEDWVVDMVKNI